MNLSSKTAIVTDASRGIGAAFSRALTAKGATVYGLARNLEPLKALQQELGKKFFFVNIYKQ